MRFATSLHVVSCAWVVGCAYPTFEFGAGTGGAQSVGGSTGSGGTSNSTTIPTSSMGTAVGGNLAVGGNAGGTVASGGFQALGGTANVGGIHSNSGGAVGAGGASVQQSGGATGASTVVSTQSTATTGGAGGAGGSLGSGGSSNITASGGKSTQGGTTNLGSGGTSAVTGGTSAVMGGSSATGGTSASTSGAGSSGVPITLPPAGDFTDTVGSASVDMIAIPGGSFTLGCESGSCDTDTSPVANILVSDYHVMKTEVSPTTWTAAGLTQGNWYDCMALACELTKRTGHAYRMMTEAEFEYAAKKYLSKLTEVDGSEEWAFNTWENAYSCKPGDVDPLGPEPGSDSQKTRRDKATGNNITGRLVRAIGGIGPKCRLTISDKTDYPPGYAPPCTITPPGPLVEPDNSYRDPRWVTGSDAHWATGPAAMGSFDLRVWDDGTARLNDQDGQWFTSNNIAFVFVPSSGSNIKFPYIFLDATHGSVISDTSYESGGYLGRIVKESATNHAKPTVSSPKSGAELAAATAPGYAMVDMENIPASAKERDSRLIDTTSDCWFQNNFAAGATHNYRKDVDADEFRFAVIDGGQVFMLANGSWFTVNNTFLRITHSGGYVTDYLYAVDAGGTFYHASYQKYERGDFRMFEKYANAGGLFPADTCISDSCSKELPKGEAASPYASMEEGKSTFVPALCPAGGCL